MASRRRRADRTWGIGRIVLYAVLGLLVAAATMLVTAPASLVDLALKRATDGRVRLADASGSIWTGQGTGGAGRRRHRTPTAIGRRRRRARARHRSPASSSRARSAGRSRPCRCSSVACRPPPATRAWRKPVAIAGQRLPAAGHRRLAATARRQPRTARLALDHGQADGFAGHHLAADRDRSGALQRPGDPGIARRGVGADAGPAAWAPTGSTSTAPATPR